MLEIKNLTFGYNETPVLENLNFTCGKGEVRGVLGPNGAGKTTFFNLLFGFLKPEFGTILLNGKPIEQGQISYLETEPYFYPLIKGKEYLEVLTSKNPSFDVNYWNKLFELPLDSLIETYSTGMRKKIAIMGILARDAEILLLDEPYNGVDLETVETIYFILEKLKEKGKIVLLTSHVLPTLTTACNQIDWLKDKHFFKSFDKAQFPQLEIELQSMIREHIEGRMGEG